MNRPPARGAKRSAPAHLDPHEAAMWASLTSAYRLDDPGAEALLEVALGAHMRLRRCRQVIDKDGESVVDRFQQVKPHPLLQAERDARSAFISGMKALNLDLGE